MLPAPLAVGRAVTSSASSVGMSRSSEEHYNSDNGSAGSNLRLTSSPTTAEHYVDSPDPSAARLLPPSPYNSQSFRQNSMPQPPSMIENPFRSSTTSNSHEDHSIFTPDYDELSGRGGVGGRGVRLMDSGPVPGPEGVRRVSRPRRPTSQTPTQNRYSRNSFNLPPGAAPPQQNFGT